MLVGLSYVEKIGLHGWKVVLGTKELGVLHYWAGAAFRALGRAPAVRMYVVVL